MNPDKVAEIIAHNFHGEFSDANTICYSNFDLFSCSGALFEFVYTLDKSTIKSKLWVCKSCIPKIEGNDQNNDISDFL